MENWESTRIYLKSCFNSITVALPAHLFWLWNRYLPVWDTAINAHTRLNRERQYSINLPLTPLHLLEKHIFGYKQASVKTDVSICAHNHRTHRLDLEGETQNLSWISFIGPFKVELMLTSCQVALTKPSALSDVCEDVVRVYRMWKITEAEHSTKCICLCMGTGWSHLKPSQTLANVYNGFLS